MAKVNNLFHLKEEISDYSFTIVQKTYPPLVEGEFKGRDWGGRK